MIAISLIRQDPHYRREAFDNGLRKAGYRLVTSGAPAGPEDLLVIWNRYGQFEQRANAWETAGGTVLVAENGYLGADEQGRQLYALAAKGHNGSGWWPIGDEDRFGKLGIPLKPWRTDGQHIVVRGQRGIGTALMKSPNNWHENAAYRIRKMTDRPVKVVPHPGNVKDRRGAEHLVGAWACVVWSSAMGVYALTEGIPVLYDAPRWICDGAATRISQDNIAAPMTDDGLRLAALRRMACAQFNVAELESGEPFVRFRDEIRAGTMAGAAA